MSYQIFVVSELFILEQALKITFQMFSPLLQALTLASQQNVRLLRELDLRLFGLVVHRHAADFGVTSSSGVSVGFVSTRFVSTRSLKFVDPFDRLADFAAFDRHLTGRCFFDLKNESHFFFKNTSIMRFLKKKLIFY